MSGATLLIMWAAIRADLDLLVFSLDLFFADVLAELNSCSLILQISNAAECLNELAAIRPSEADRLALILSLILISCLSCQLFLRSSNQLHSLPGSACKAYSLELGSSA